MVDDLGARLVQAGLVTKEQLAGARSAAPLHEGALVSALVERGLSEDAAAGFFVASGLGPLVGERELFAPEPGALRRLSGAMATELLALPLRESAAGLVVAMVAPSDRHALAELRRAVRGEVLPTTARATQLREALRRAYPGAELPGPPLLESEPPPLELVARRKKPAETADGYAGSTRGAARADARALVGPCLTLAEDDGVVPLVRQKAAAPPPPPPPPRNKVITRSFEKPSERELREAREALAREATPPSPRLAASPPKKSIIPPEHAQWDVDGGPENKVDRAKLHRVSSPPKRAERPSPVGGTLAAIRASRDRDEVVELACRGALTVARAAVLLALKKGVLKGWDGAGAGLTREAVRNVWIPTNSPSMFRDVVARGEPYSGAHGTSAADGLFRAAVGSRGGQVALQPIAIGGKVVAVLAADDVGFEREGKERIEILARAVSEAFERIIVESKLR